MPAISGGILFQNSLFVGLNLVEILYGIELALYIQTMETLLGRRGKRTRSDTFYAIFSTVMLLVVTYWLSAQAVFAQHMWIIDADFPGGPSAYWEANITLWYMDIATTTVIVLQLMTDGLMVYRCWAVWNSYYVVIVPSILWLVTLVLGVLVAWSSIAPGGLYFRKNAVLFSLVYISLSVALTVMATCMICLRIISHAWKVRKHLARKHASPYFAITALVVESVLPYSASGIAWVVSLALGSQTMGTFGYVHTLMMCVSPQMLILLVARRRAWSDYTSATQPLSTVMFAPQSDTFTSEIVSQTSNTEKRSRNDGDNAI